MLRKIIIIAAVVFIPIVFYFASQYGEMETVTFAKAIDTAESETEDKASSVIVVTTIVSMDGHDMYGEDRTGRQFKVDYTGSEHDDPFAAGQTVRFVGHVHGDKAPYFHATQVYGK